MSNDRATGADDPDLVDTTWPMPGDHSMGVNHRLVWGQATKDDMAFASAVMAAYATLIRDGTTTSQVAKLRALRRVHAKRRAKR